MRTAKEVADYFLSLSNPELGDSITNLKLQKLCYYAQGFHLAMNGGPLFADKIEAWQHGPVVPSLYHSLKQHGSAPIPSPERVAISEDSKVAAFLNDVFEAYGQFSAWKLRDMTHSEPPWKNAGVGGTITVDSMRAYFSSLLSD